MFLKNEYTSLWLNSFLFCLALTGWAGTMILVFYSFVTWTLPAITLVQYLAVARLMIGVSFILSSSLTLFYLGIEKI